MIFRDSAIVAALTATLFAVAASEALDPTSLNGESFKITLVEADGFVNSEADGEFSGYIIDMIESVAKKAGFEYDLLLPSGYGDNCPSILDANYLGFNANAVDYLKTAGVDPYNAVYASSYLCGQNDVIGPGDIPEESQTDMYWSMYYVTTSRQLAGKFSVAFKPPTQGLTMYGTQTGVGSFEDLITQQKDDKVGAACIGGNTAYAAWLANALPDLQTIEIENTEAAAEKALESGKCTVIINAEHAALKFVNAHFLKGKCKIDGKPVGIIGEGLQYGLTQMAIGFNDNVPEDTIRVISYWMNDLMTCAPNDEGCGGSLYASWLAKFGTSDACGYVSDPEPSDMSGSSAITTVATTVVAGAVTAFAAIVGEGLLA
ncbi:hypothetical protein FRACYDRAFT_235153 [Fragilariopsis cylindrus CCMP1102]|uniref:Periplasmic binding protein-like II n=1 Tax=Fragilariopsis cylindrus CCMP1102 TaxID=635003 RepID=A0A1E7FTN8_9STRA|nr:hypothetical protein FRACYDRAFT_235153 [Fragilariopsis cylindrus CCMP1102]|eukprot:OEU21528.1 hypothetical protein FRACYDRAFT_235153 [Fragilariopsis cylindrus CCMP1102]